MRFISNKKAILVIAVLLATILFLSGCAPSPANGAPDFLEVGSYYLADFSDGHSYYFKVLEIRDDGWILVAEGQMRKKLFFNTVQIVCIREIERPAWWDR